MDIPFLEPTAPRYIYIDPVTNEVFLLLPITSGESIGQDNTCKTVLALKEFFEMAEGPGAAAELQQYKQALEFDISVIPNETEVKQQKRVRLEQITRYLAAFESVQQKIRRLNKQYPEYPPAIKKLMEEHSNLFSMVLRPTLTDPVLRSSNPVFSVNRRESLLYNMSTEQAAKPIRANCYIWDWEKDELIYNAYDGRRETLTFTDKQGFIFRMYEERAFQSNSNPLKLTPSEKRDIITNNCMPQTIDAGECLYAALKEQYQNINIPEQGPKAMLTQAIVVSEADTPVNFKQIQAVLAKKCNELFGMSVDFLVTKDRINPQDINSPYIEATQAYINAEMGFNNDTTTTVEYVSALLNYCTTADFETLAISTMPVSPFNTVENNANAAETLSILTQFSLGEMNIHCVSHGLSEDNFGFILDDSQRLSLGVAKTVMNAVENGISVEDDLCAYINEHSSSFHLNSQLGPNDIREIKQKFTEHYTAIRNSDHFDEFILLDTTIKKGKFVNHQGSICTDFSEMIGAGYRELDNDRFFEKKRTAFLAINGTVNPRNDWVKAEGFEMEESQFIAWLMTLAEPASGMAGVVLFNVLKNLPSEVQVAFILKLDRELLLIMQGLESPRLYRHMKTLSIEGQVEFAMCMESAVRNKGISRDAVMFASFLKGLLPATRTAFLKRMDARVLSLELRKGEQLAAILKILPEVDQTVLMTKLRPYLISIIKNDQQLGLVLTPLSEELQTVLMTQLGPNLTSIIKNGSQVAGVLTRLSPKEKTALMTILNANIISLIENADQLSSVLSTLSQEDQRTLMRTLGLHCISMIEQCSDLIMVAGHMLPDLQKEFFMTVIPDLEPDLPRIFAPMDAMDELSLLLKMLSPEVQDTLIKTLILVLGADFVPIIRNNYVLNTVVDSLSTSVDDQIVLIKTLGLNLVPLLHDQSDLLIVLKKLLPEAQIVLIRELGEINITSHYDYNLINLLEVLSLDAQIALIQMLSENIKNSTELVFLLKQMDLMPVTQKILIKVLRPNLSLIIPDVPTLVAVAQDLTTPVQIALIKNMENLSSIVVSKANFKPVRDILSLDARLATNKLIDDLLSGKFAGNIDRTKDVRQAVEELPDEENTSPPRPK